ncbi:polysaccharide pyruvyl transferase family protein, partial [Candidatus Gracilibacteria bacterium]|nr:polysaccharide pyruvyl transferase family protein [Candidatus Gracilibacteria bacterium]
FVREHYGKNVDITVFAYDLTDIMTHDPDIHFASYFPNKFGVYPFRNIKFFFQNIWLISRADVLIIGGGGIIFDNEPGVSFAVLFMQWALRINTARMFRTTILFWGIGLEITHVANKMKLKKLFVPGDFILVRDKQSKGLLDALEIPSLQVHDIVFLYKPPVESRPLSDIKPIGISIRGGFIDNEASIPLIYDELVSLGYKPIFLVFSTEGEESQNDVLFIRRVMAGRKYNITKNITQTLDVYPFLYAIVGMRLHAGILACVHHIPYIPISYGPKTDEIIKLLDIQHLAIQSTELNKDFFMNKWNALIENYDQEHLKMSEKHAFLSETLKKSLENL